MASPGLIFGTLFRPPSPPGVIPEYWARDNQLLSPQTAEVQALPCMQALVLLLILHIPEHCWVWHKNQKGRMSNYTLDLLSLSNEKHNNLRAIGISELFSKINLKFLFLLGGAVFWAVLRTYLRNSSWWWLGSIWDARDETRVGQVHGKCPTCCIFNSVLIYLFIYLLIYLF